MKDRGKLVRLLEGAMENEDARAFVAALADHCLADVLDVSPTPHTQYYKIGRQEVGHFILALMKEAAPDVAAQHIKSQGEALRHERNRRNANS